MPLKYVVKKMKGACYDGSEKIAAKGLALRRYASLDAVKKMAKARHLSASSLMFNGVSKNEQRKILGMKASKPKSKKKVNKRR